MDIRPDQPAFVTVLAKVAANRGVQDENDRGAYRISASNLGIALGPEHSSCPLAFWLLINGKCRRKPVKPGMHIMHEAGKNMEHTVMGMLVEALRGTDWRIKAQQLPVIFEVDGTKYESTLDILLENVRTFDTMVVDTKTSRGRAFQYRKEAKPGHVLQVQAYMKAVDATYGAVWYIDREGQNFMDIFPVERADHRVDQAVLRLESIKEDIAPRGVGYEAVRRQNKGPDAIYVNRHWFISYCDVDGCPCAKSYPEPPKAKVASVHEEGEGRVFLRLTDIGRKWWPKVRESVRALWPDDIQFETDEGPA